MAENDPQLDAVATALRALHTHYRTWRHAIEYGLCFNRIGNPDADDRAFVKRELAVFDQVVSALALLDVHIDGGIDG